MIMIRKKLKGLSLIEVITSIGVFSLMMVTIAGIFGSSISSSRANRVVERNLENAQFVMNEMAKELRTSTIVDTTFSSGSNTFASHGVNNHIRFFDYSQGRCIEYRMGSDGTNNYIERAAFIPVVAVGEIPRDKCKDDATTTTALGTYTRVTTGHVVPSFSVVTSSNGGGNSALARVGLVTMVFVVKEKPLGTQSVTLQTTVSLRDYAESGIVH